jgi:hypothetical protein
MDTLSSSGGTRAGGALPNHVRQYAFLLAAAQWACSKHGAHSASSGDCCNAARSPGKSSQVMKPRTVCVGRSRKPGLWRYKFLTNLEAERLPKNCRHAPGTQNSICTASNWTPFLDPFLRRPLYLYVAPWRTYASVRASASFAASGRGCGGFRC